MSYSTFVPVFNTHTVTPQVSISSFSHDFVTVICTTSGAPATIQWSYPNGSRRYENNEAQLIVHTLQNGNFSIYTSGLTFASFPQLGDIGEHVCISTTKYVGSNSSDNEIITITGMVTRLYRVYKTH